MYKFELDNVNELYGVEARIPLGGITTEDGEDYTCLTEAMEFFYKRGDDYSDLRILLPEDDVEAVKRYIEDGLRYDDHFSDVAAEIDEFCGVQREPDGALSLYQLNSRCIYS